ncbi:MAG: hypothetical protein ACXAC5_01050 [Promethearchaeota archaeon]|jgi:hypothetical protein
MSDFNYWKQSLNFDYHRYDNFREQIAILTPLEIDEDEGVVKLLRSFIHVCQSGAASFDPENPGADTLAAWQIMDEYVETRGVRGFFHTHPPGMLRWSGQDVRTQNGLAKANGQMMLWYGVQAASRESLANVPNCGRPAIEVHGSEFVCSWMEHGRVFRYSYGMIEDDLKSPLIVLPLPPALQWLHGAYIIDPQA